MFYDNMEVLAPHEDGTACEQRLCHVPSWQTLKILRKHLV